MKPFRDILDTAVRSFRAPAPSVAGSTCRTVSGELCTLCHAVRLDYDTEVRLKNQALLQFWSQSLRPSLLRPLVSSPLGRRYRMVTKRKAFHARNRVYLGFIDPEHETTHGRVEVIQCDIEPDSHAAIYADTGAALRLSAAAALAESLQHVIIKGTHEEQLVIFSVARAGPAIQKACNIVSKSLTKRHPHIVGLYLYIDETRGGYYLGMKDPESPGRLQRIFGKRTLAHRVRGKNFVFPPLAFVQINHSLLDGMTQTAEQLLDPAPDQTLYDLYCGYGLFALSLASRARRTIGSDIAATSIEAARTNASRFGIHNARFVRNNLDAASVADVIREMSNRDVVLLDPPRKGTPPGVIEAIAARSPVRVLHIFCNIDILPAQAAQWEQEGYQIREAVPLDMFPGTSSVEVFVLLTRH